MSPSALSLLTVVFEEGPERNKALGIFSAITAGGAALGLILGGVLTEYASLALGAVRERARRRHRRRRRPALPAREQGRGRARLRRRRRRPGHRRPHRPGLRAGQAQRRRGRDRRPRPATFVLAAVLLGAFVAVQLRSRTPLLPFRLFRSRSLLGADLSALLIGAGIFAMFFFVTLWMQVINGYSPVKAGFAFLPMTLVIGVGAGLSSNLLAKTGPRPLLVTGTSLAGPRHADARPAARAGQQLPDDDPAVAGPRRPRHGPGLRRPDQRRRGRASARPTPASPRRCSTPASRSAAPSASPSSPRSAPRGPSRCSPASRAARRTSRATSPRWSRAGAPASSSPPASWSARRSCPPLLVRVSKEDAVAALKEAVPA